MVDVVCMGNPLLDLVIHVDESALSELGIEKSSMNLIDQAESERVLNLLAEKQPTKLLGGSAANTAAGVCQLGGSSVFIGKLGSDENGTYYKEQTKTLGVEPQCGVADLPTGHSIILITPDAERTMLTHLGAAVSLSEQDIDASFFAGKYFHVTGYLLGDPTVYPVVVQAVKFAKQHGAKISIDIANAFIVSHNKELFTSFLTEYADIVFANEEEATAFADKNPEEALEVLGKLVSVAVVKLGEDGSLIACGNTRIAIDAYEVSVEDLNGAGDMYAAGFLFGLSQDLSLEQAAELANYAAAQVVAHRGARLDRSLVDEVKQFF